MRSAEQTTYTRISGFGGEPDFLNQCPVYGNQTKGGGQARGLISIPQVE